jgi:cell division protein FtsW
MTAFARTDTSLVGRWWWTIDRWTLAALLALAFAGVVLTLAASPAVAHRIGLDPFHFARRQFVFLPLAFAVMALVSFLSPRGVRRLALAVTAAALALMAAALAWGQEIKGATRWIQVGGLSIQPSEFAKPGFAVVAAWLFAAQRFDERVPGYALATGLCAVVVGLLVLQPDVGMALVIAAVWAAEFFLVGLPLLLVAVLAAALAGGAAAAYVVFPHVHQRIDRFLDPQAGESYQVARALDAMRHGGLYGQGPGEGRVKSILPDAHADFIFAVAGEEFGLIACLAVVGLFAFVVLRGFCRAFKGEDLFALLAVSGLLVQFGLQALVNVASTLNLVPTKGMTLPFISYGGSSTLALALGMGMVLALTRERPRAEATP